MHVYKVMDGGTHWVGARQVGHAAQIMADSLGMSRLEYGKVHDPTIREMKPHDEIEILQEDAMAAVPCPDGLPKNTSFRVTAVTRVKDWIAMGFEGIIATTEV